MDKYNNEQEETYDIDININEAKQKKIELLLELGTMTYEHIRKNKINRDLFDNIDSQILEIDKVIYENNLKIKEQDHTKEIEYYCECGYEFKSGDKFCAECGEKRPDEEVEYATFCKICDNIIDEDSNYCICCGSKLSVI